MSAPNTLGVWMKEKRQDLEMTQEEFIAALTREYGKTFARSTVSSWEHGKDNAPIHDREFVSALARIFRVRDVDVLAGAGYNVAHEVTLTDKEAVILDAYRRGDFKKAMQLLIRD